MMIEVRQAKIKTPFNIKGSPDVPGTAFHYLTGKNNF